MMQLVDAAAYIVQKAIAKDKLDRLGKLKLYKMLYLADWYSFESTGETLFNITWNRIEKGPALTEERWSGLLRSLSDQYGIRAYWEQVGKFPQVKFEVTRAIAVPVANQARELLDKAFGEIIDLFAKDAPRLAYQTSPMLWILAEERYIGGAIQYREFEIANQQRQRFEALARQYAEGAISIPHICREMGGDWTESKVALFLETLGYFRPLSMLPVSLDEERVVLTALARRRKMAPLSSLTDSVSVVRDVVSSNRIESVYVSPDAFVEEDSEAPW